MKGSDSHDWGQKLSQPWLIILAVIQHRCCNAINQSKSDIRKMNSFFSLFWLRKEEKKMTKAPDGIVPDPLERFCFRFYLSLVNYENIDVYLVCHAPTRNLNFTDNGALRKKRSSLSLLMARMFFAWNDRNTRKNIHRMYFLRGFVILFSVHVSQPNLDTCFGQMGSKYFFRLFICDSQKSIVRLIYTRIRLSDGIELMFLVKKSAVLRFRGPFEILFVYTEV